MIIFGMMNIFDIDCKIYQINICCIIDCIWYYVLLSPIFVFIIICKYYFHFIMLLNSIKQYFIHKIYNHSPIKPLNSQNLKTQSTKVTNRNFQNLIISRIKMNTYLNTFLIALILLLILNMHNSTSNKLSENFVNFQSGLLHNLEKVIKKLDKIEVEWSENKERMQKIQKFILEKENSDQKLDSNKKLESNITLKSEQEGNKKYQKQKQTIKIFRQYFHLLLKEIQQKVNDYIRAAEQKQQQLTSNEQISNKQEYLKKEIQQVHQKYQMAIQAYEIYQYEYYKGIQQEILYLNGTMNNLEKLNLKKIKQIKLQMEKLNGEIPITKIQILNKINVAKRIYIQQFKKYQKIELNLKELQRKFEQFLKILTQKINVHHQIFNQFQQSVHLKFNNMANQIQILIFQDLKQSYRSYSQRLASKLLETDTQIQRNNKIDDFINQMDQLISQKNIQLDQNLELLGINIQILIESNRRDIVQTLFNNKTINQMQLIYRASEHNFSVNAFWNKSHNISNVIIFVKNQFNKVLGGYTATPWNKNLINLYSEDPTLQSFIFDLTQRETIPLAYHQLAIYNSPVGNWGPIFGSSDIVIFNKANQHQNNCVNIGSAYRNEKYPGRSEENSRKFSGNKNGNNFKIIQWEVYILKFD